MKKEEANEDAIAKSILSSKQFCAYILRRAINELYDYSEQEIVQMLPGIGSKIQMMNVESKDPKHGEIRYDLLFPLIRNGKIMCLVNIEMQGNVKSKSYLTKRGTYYLGRMISDQKNTIFKNMHYEEMVHCYSIWICCIEKKKTSIEMYKYGREEMDYQQIHEEKYNPLRSVMCFLGNQTHYNGIKQHKELIQFLNLSFKQGMVYNEVVEILRETYKIDLDDKLTKEINEMSTLRESWIKQGRKEGEIEGKKEGKKEERLAANIEYIKKVMNKLECSLEEAMDFLEINEDSKKYKQYIH